MKIIFSRKGFDSKAGGCASPIFTDDQDRILSLPIPITGAPVFFKEIQFKGDHIGDLVKNLSGGKRNGCDRAHLDPDLRKDAIPRLEGWKPSFGQSSSAQSHLRNSGVGIGDLFLFFGWFRRVEKERYVQSPKDLHVIFGWLQVDRIIEVNNNLDRILHEFPWLKDHPHLKKPEVDLPNNTIYIAKDRLSIPGSRLKAPGGGVFEHLSDARTLTDMDPYRSRSLWRIPSFFHHSDRKLTYHLNDERWGPLHQDGKTTLLRSVPIGQEFVTEWGQANKNEEDDWLGQIFKD
jgi:hypothetical protein